MKTHSVGLKLLLEYKKGAYDTVINQQQVIFDIMAKATTLSETLRLYDELKLLYKRENEVLLDMKEIDFLLLKTIYIEE
jgi:hypothetical protein